MIEINLLPPELKKKKKKKKIKPIVLPDIPIIPILAAVVAALVGLQVLVTLMAGAKIRTRSKLEGEWSGLEPAREEIQQLKQANKEINSKVDIIEGLISDRLPWSEKLNGLSDSMVSGVWLERLSMINPSGKDKKGSFALDGCTVAPKGEEPAAVARFIKSLKANKRFFEIFRDIELTSIERAMVKDIEVMKFRLVLYFK